MTELEFDRSQKFAAKRMGRMPSTTPQMTLGARWVFPVSEAPIEDGQVTIHLDRIVAVEKRSQHKPDFDLGNVAIVPGLVNAHTHLDLSGLRGQAPPSRDFTAWLRQIIAHRRGQTSAEIQSAIQAGVNECLASGTTLVGDIAGSGLSWDLLHACPLRAIVFYELLGFSCERAAQVWQEFQGWYVAHPSTATCRPGISPHSPYSVRASLFERAKQFSGQHSLPLAIHIAESSEELDLLAHHCGPFVPFLTELGIWEPEGLVRNWRQILPESDAAQALLLVHGNYLDSLDELPQEATLVYCPRTHAAFGHDTHPLIRAQRLGGAPACKIALGTDSLASNPDLSILAEMRYLHRQCPEIDGSRILQMGTLAGAKALGWHHEVGSLASGKSADLVVIPLPDNVELDPHQTLLGSTDPVTRVMLRGQWVFWLEK